MRPDLREVKISNSLFSEPAYPSTFAEDPSGEELAVYLRGARGAYDATVLKLRGVCLALEALGMTECPEYEKDPQP